MWINRQLSGRLKSLSTQFPAILLTGGRQTGKTSLLREVFPEASFVTFDLPSVAHLAETDPEIFFKMHSLPVILDEVQYVPQIFRSLKGMIDQSRHRMGQILMSGSQKFALMKSVSESLAGRCAIVELDTLSSTEVREAFPGKTPSLSSFMWKGGFPELYRHRDLNPVEFYHSYVVTYMERDLRSLLKVESLRDFERFLRAAALRSGQLLNLAEMARDIGIAASTARDWLSVLEASNQVVLLEPYFNNFGKRMIKAPKLYFKDTGLLCFLLGLDSPAMMEKSHFIGAIWETFVLGQILREKSFSASSAGVYFWRDAHGVEVDFVIESGGILRLVEVKWAEDPSSTGSVASLEKVRQLIGARGAEEHWIACRAKHSFKLRHAPHIRVLNGFEFDEWIRQ